MIALPIAIALLSAAPTLVASQSTDSGTYTPSFTQCPNDFSLVRTAGSPTSQTLSPSESAYVTSRKSNVLPGAWNAYLKNVQATNVTLPDYVSGILNGSANGTSPTLGLSTSGGGYRAAIFGAGVLNALDGRHDPSVAAGTGGLLQAATYLAGLSGGSWLVTSLAQTDFPTVNDLIFGANTSAYAGWVADYNILQPGGINTTLNEVFVEGILQEISGKYAAGFPVTIGDIWGAALSRHFLNGTTEDETAFFSNTTSHGVGITFSSIASIPSFVSFAQPFPIIVSDLQSPKGNLSTIIAADDPIPQSNPIFEFSVYEMGSYDPVLSAFTPTEYLGTTNTSVCVTGFDSAGFIMGSSSQLFNEFNTSAAALLNSSVGPFFVALNETLPQSPAVELDASLYPNPFFGYANETFISSTEENLVLVDGGEDGEVMPLQPLLVKARGVDVIFAIDAANDDAYDYSEGASLIASAKRASLFPSAYSFPPVPTNTSIMTSQNLTTRPTFFGCDTDTSAPLVVYVANGGPPRNGSAPATNTTTLQLQYDAAQIVPMLDQSFVVATQGFSPNTTGLHDSEWPACLACAIVDRARNRSGTARSGVCASCFERYCWNGDDTLASTGGGGGSAKSAAISDIAVSRYAQIAGGVLALMVSAAAVA